MASDFMEHPLTTLIKRDYKKTMKKISMKKAMPLAALISLRIFALIIMRSLLFSGLFLSGLVSSGLFSSGLYAASNDAQPFLWKIQSRYSTVYLAGSIHALNDDYYPLANSYLSAFNQADKLVLELNIDNINPAKAQALVKYKTWLPTERSLEEYLNQEELTLLRHYAKQAGLTYATLIRMRPWMVIETLTGYQLRQSNFNTGKGVDQYFLTMAKEKKMPILELESLEQQINAMADAPFASQLAALSLSLKQMEDNSYLTTMADYWQQGDNQGLYNFVYQDMQNYPAIKPMMIKLLDDRNRNMTDIIGIYLATHQTYFIVVGALHLSGPQSILAMLENKGYKIEKVTSPN